MLARAGVAERTHDHPGAPERRIGRPLPLHAPPRREVVGCSFRVAALCPMWPTARAAPFRSRRASSRLCRRPRRQSAPAPWAPAGCPRQRPLRPWLDATGSRSRERNSRTGAAPPSPLQSSRTRRGFGDRSPAFGCFHAVIVACCWIGRNARLRALRHRNSLAACAGADFRIDARAHARPPSRLAFRLRPIDRVPSAPSEDRAGEDAAPAHPGPPPQAAIAAHPVDRVVVDIENRGGLADVIGGLVRRLLPSLAFLEERAAHAEAKSGQRPFTPRPLRARPRTPASRACSSAARSRRT